MGTAIIKQKLLDIQSRLWISITILYHFQGLPLIFILADINWLPGVNLLKRLNMELIYDSINAQATKTKLLVVDDNLDIYSVIESALGT